MIIASFIWLRWSAILVKPSPLFECQRLLFDFSLLSSNGKFTFPFCTLLSTIAFEQAHRARYERKQVLLQRYNWYHKTAIRGRFGIILSWFSYELGPRSMKRNIIKYQIRRKIILTSSAWPCLFAYDDHHPWIPVQRHLCYIAVCFSIVLLISW